MKPFTINSASGVLSRAEICPVRQLPTSLRTRSGAEEATYFLCLSQHVHHVRHAVYLVNVPGEHAHKSSTGSWTSAWRGQEAHEPGALTLRTRNETPCRLADSDLMPCGTLLGEHEGPTADHW